MKTGFENRNAVIVMVVLAALGLLLFVRMLAHWGEPPAPNPAAAQRHPVTADSTRAQQRGAALPAPEERLDPTLRLDLLRAAEENQYRGSGRNIFRAQAEPPPIPKPVAPAVTGDGESAQPSGPPPIELKFFGFASREGEPKKIFLAKDGEVFIAQEGDIVNRRYRVVRIGQNSVEVEDVFDNRRETLPLESRG